MIAWHKCAALPSVAEILLQVMHERSPPVTFIGALGVVVVLTLKELEGLTKGPVHRIAAEARECHLYLAEG